MYEKALQIRLATSGEQHPDTASTKHNMALAYHRKGEYDKALQIDKAALQIFLHTLGEQHPLTAQARRLISEAKAKLVAVKA
eukprot:m.22564 g.22564  ORF g.22564 m.22564 type:complete len:82 (+) comp9237_c0_seq1:1-246(+)